MLGEYFSRIAEDDQTELPPFYLQWAVFYGSFTSIAGMLAGACSFEAVDLRFWLWAGLVGFVLIFAIDPRTEWSERPRRWLILTVFSEASRRISPSDEKEEVQSEASDESLFCLVTKLAFLELAGAGVWFVFLLYPVVYRWLAWRSRQVLFGCDYRIRLGSCFVCIFVSTSLGGEAPRALTEEKKGSVCGRAVSQPCVPTR